MKKETKLNCRAKVNLSLDVVSRRSDGYHNLEMIMCEAGPADIIHIEVDTKQSGIYVKCSRADIPSDEENLAAKAAKAFLRHVNQAAQIKIYIEKNIPTAAGLGGGSSDAAGVIKALNGLLGCNLSHEEMAIIGKQIGADVPFFIYGGCMLAKGIGEKLSPLPILKGAVILIAKPNISISTPSIFKKLILNENIVHPDTAFCVKAVSEGNLQLLASSAGNVLESVTEKEHPIISEYKDIMLSYGAVYSLMSGSGPSVFGVFDNPNSANKAYEKFSEITDEVYI